MRHISFVVLLALFFSCEKNKLAQKIEIDPTGSALVKFGYFTPWVRNVPIHIKVNDVRISNTITYALCFPGGGFNQGGQTFADYIAVNAEQLKMPVKISLAIPKSGTNEDSVVLYTGNISLEINKRQTIMFTDSVPNIQATVISDEVPAGALPIALTNARFKFFNGIPNVGTNIDLYAVSNSGTFLVASNIPYKGVSGYFDMPAGVAAGTITFRMIRTGQTNTDANLVGGSSTGHPYGTSSLLNGREYTILARGFTGVSSTSTIRQQVTINVNR
jgi:hypothetical protein